MGDDAKENNNESFSSVGCLVGGDENRFSNQILDILLCAPLRESSPTGTC